MVEEIDLTNSDHEDAGMPAQQPAKRVDPLEISLAEREQLAAQLAEKDKEVARLQEEREAKEAQEQIEKEEREALEKENKLRLEQEAREQDQSDRKNAEDQVDSLGNEWNRLLEIIQGVEFPNNMQRMIPPNQSFPCFMADVIEEMKNDPDPTLVGEGYEPKNFEDMVEHIKDWLVNSRFSAMKSSAAMLHFIKCVQKVLKQNSNGQNEDVLKNLTRTPFSQQFGQIESSAQAAAQTLCQIQQSSPSTESAGMASKELIAQVQRNMGVYNEHMKTKDKTIQDLEEENKKLREKHKELEKEHEMVKGDKKRKQLVDSDDDNNEEGSSSAQQLSADGNKSRTKLFVGELSHEKKLLRELLRDEPRYKTYTSWIQDTRQQTRTKVVLQRFKTLKKVGVKKHEDAIKQAITTLKAAQDRSLKRKKRGIVPQ